MTADKGTTCKDCEHYGYAHVLEWPWWCIMEHVEWGYERVKE